MRSLRLRDLSCLSEITKVESSKNRSFLFTLSHAISASPTPISSPHFFGYGWAEPNPNSHCYACTCYQAALTWALRCLSEGGRRTNIGFSAVWLLSFPALLSLLREEVLGYRLHHQFSSRMIGPERLGFHCIHTFTEHLQARYHVRYCEIKTLKKIRSLFLSEFEVVTKIYETTLALALQ